ncbi:MAG: hypothetical protein IT424_06820 [Pirellulales bacterium]|nr:hypothetical protein [Pirellulales bacterium]
MQTVGEALTAVAISLMPPSPGASFAIPSVFLPFEAVDGPDGTPATSAYSNARRSWVDGMVTASQITLRFQTPKSLAPLAIEKATLHVEISAPSRVVTLAGWQGEVATPLQRVTSPVGRLTAAIPDARMLGLDSTGGLRVNINVSSHPREQEANISKVGWSVQNVWLDIDAARTSPR